MTTTLEPRPESKYTPNIPTRPHWKNPGKAWFIRNWALKLTYARPWNWQLILAFFRLIVSGSRLMKKPILGSMYKAVMLFSPVDRRYTYSVVLPLNADLSREADSTPLPIDLIKDCLRSASYIASQKACICRDAKNCRTHPKDLCCLFLSKSGRRVVEHGVAYEISLEDALKRVDEAQARGLVGEALWVEVEQFVWGFKNDEMDTFLEICFCCPCCCVGLTVCKNATRDVKSHFNNAGYQAVVDLPKCVACNDCIPGCPGEAITAIEGGIEINHSHCIGCGLCARTCPTDAIKLPQTAYVWPSLAAQYAEQGGIDLRLQA